MAAVVGLRLFVGGILLVGTVMACATPGAAPTVNEPSVPAPSTAASAATASAASPSVSPAPSQPRESTMAFTINSPSFTEGGTIPRKFSCDGANVSPALEWSGVPAGAAALALIVDDPDARGFVHWVVFNMTASKAGGLAEAISASRDAPPQGRSSFGKVGWGGPCPPSGTHRYVFTLLALDQKLALSGTPTADQLRAAAAGHILEQAVLTAKYTRR